MLSDRSGSSIGRVPHVHPTVLRVKSQKPNPRASYPFKCYLCHHGRLNPMGNYISCNLSIGVADSQLQGPKVILPDGSIRHAGASSITAAVFMLDHPGYFLVRSSTVHLGCRFSALCADEELQLGAVYAMFPMDRLCSVASVEDMGRLLLAPGKESALLRRPETQQEQPGDFSVPENRFRKTLCRLRMPVLDTITEEAIL